jgi:HEPN domain-containing protein
MSKAILGFHAQQAAEKLLKAVLAERQIRYPYTHYLSDLIALIKDVGLAYPPELESVDSLSSFAVDFRYLEFEEQAESFDATSALKSLLVMRDWAASIVKASQ